LQKGKFIFSTKRVVNTAENFTINWVPVSSETKNLSVKPQSLQLGTWAFSFKTAIISFATGTFLFKTRTVCLESGMFLFIRYVPP
jgi:hypothetical protein